MESPQGAAPFGAQQGQHGRASQKSRALDAGSGELQVMTPLLPWHEAFGTDRNLRFASIPHSYITRPIQFTQPRVHAGPHIPAMPSVLLLPPQNQVPNVDTHGIASQPHGKCVHLPKWFPHLKAHPAHSLWQ